jgi:prophage antirepressor-like protein
VAKDVCDVLGIGDARKSVGLLDDDEREIVPVIDSLGRSQSTFIINESGLYSLILRSRKSEDKRKLLNAGNRLRPAKHIGYPEDRVESTR